jgi:ubiquinone/menaquinone biosynthesis C-methylase UbiE
MDHTDTIESVKDYYGKRLEGSDDLKTNACCSIDAMPAEHRAILEQIDDEILARFYGCGSPIPPLLDGSVVLDLGCGTGRDVYMTSRLVGEKGLVIGVDMTEEQLKVAKRHVKSQTERFGFAQPNVKFYHGYIEDLNAIGIADNSIDAVISNCVINLSPNKEAVFAEIFRVLKPGGELYFSDVFASRRVPQHLKDDPELYGECLSGALYTEDFRRIMQRLGCLDHRIVKKSKIQMMNAELEQRVGNIDFFSVTVRAFKLESLEDICEDYGQAATYLGTIPDHPHSFQLDDHHIFETGKPMLVCGNTAAMVSETRYAKHFRLGGDRSTHFGPFDCGDTSADTDAIAACC